MRADYLAGLDGMIASGLSGLGRAFRRARAQYVRSRQADDGGFCGRVGGSDIYYTDFALRALLAIDPDSDALERAASYLESLTGPPRNTVECFSRLNSARILRAVGFEVPDQASRCRPDIDIRHAGTYDLFLAVLCYHMLGGQFPAAEQAVRRVRSCENPQGGFGQTPEGGCQTSATAAAVGLLAMTGELTTRDAGRVSDFLRTMQTAAGGFVAHAAISEPDLLSTFTALVTLSTLDGMDKANLPAIGRFVRSMAAPDGGFHASRYDTETDVEYTYYGLGTTGLLNQFVMHVRGGAD